VECDEKLSEKCVPPNARRSHVTMEEAIRILHEFGYIVIRCSDGVYAMKFGLFND